MKQNDLTINDIKKLAPQNIENLWNIYFDEEIDGYFYNILKTVNFPENIEPTIYGTYTSQPGDTWPLIAWKHYLDVRLWWIVCALNRIENPVGQPEPGTAIKILSVDIVRQILIDIKGA
jgi:LysM repeat protein